MRTYRNLYPQIISPDNLLLAWKKARKGKTKKQYVKDFEKELQKNLLQLRHELESQTYKPKPLQTFVIRDPKTRKISKSDFRDRVIHHALCNIIEPIFDKIFISDSYANRKGKGNLKAVERFHSFMRKASGNGKAIGQFSKNQIRGYCLKADVRRYFWEISHEILLKIISRKIKDKKAMWLIQRILENRWGGGERKTSMPLGNLTSQFFANIYLNELDYFVKHTLRAKFYIRYVDDFVIFHTSEKQLAEWKSKINQFLKSELELELHPEKSRIIPLAKGVDFVGFRNFYHFRLLRKRNVRSMLKKIESFKLGNLSKKEITESFQGWHAYAKWANTHKLRMKFGELLHVREFQSFAFH